MLLFIFWVFIFRCGRATENGIAWRSGVTFRSSRGHLRAVGGHPYITGSPVSTHPLPPPLDQQTHTCPDTHGLGGAREPAPAPPKLCLPLLRLLWLPPAARPGAVAWSADHPCWHAFADERSGTLAGTGWHGNQCSQFPAGSSRRPLALPSAVCERPASDTASRLRPEDSDTALPSRACAPGPPWELPARPRRCPALGCGTGRGAVSAGPGELGAGDQCQILQHHAA